MAFLYYADKARRENPIVERGYLEQGQSERLDTEAPLNPPTDQDETGAPEMTDESSERESSDSHAMAENPTDESQREFRERVLNLNQVKLRQQEREIGRKDQDMTATKMLQYIKSMQKSVLVSSVGSIFTAVQSFSFYKAQGSDLQTLGNLMTSIFFQVFFSLVLLMVGCIDSAKYKRQRIRARS